MTNSESSCKLPHTTVLSHALIMCFVPFFAFKFLPLCISFSLSCLLFFPTLVFLSSLTHVLCCFLFVLFPFTHFPSPYSVFFLHSVLVNNAVHITRLSFLLFSAPWLDNCDSPGPVRHQLRPADWSVRSHVSAREEFFIYFTTVENSFMSAFAAWLALFSLLSVIKNFA